MFLYAFVDLYIPVQATNFQNKYQNHAQAIDLVEEESGTLIFDRF